MSVARRQNLTKSSDPSVTIAFRHSLNVHSRTADLARKQNLSEATLHRLVFNAGLEALYGLKIENNVIID